MEKNICSFSTRSEEALTDIYVLPNRFRLSFFFFSFFNNTIKNNNKKNLTWFMLPSKKCYKSNAKNLWKLVTLKTMNADLPSLLCHSPSVEWVAWGRWLMNKSLFLNNVTSESGLRRCSSLNLFPRESFVWVNKQNSICVYLKDSEPSKSGCSPNEVWNCLGETQLLLAPGNDDKQVALFQVALDHLVHVPPRHLALPVSCRVNKLGL